MLFKLATKQSLEKRKKAKAHRIFRKQEARAYSKVGMLQLLVAMFTVLFLFCVALLILIPHIATPKVEITAEKLSSIPEQYFVVTDDDSVLLQAISQLGEPVSVNSLAETEIDNWIKEHGTNNLKFQENYYKVYIPIVEPPEIYAQILLLALFGAVASGISLIYVIIANKLKTRQRNNINTVKALLSGKGEYQ
ncbi:MAG: hypothetical protein ACPLIG_00410 [Candidatus Bathyarchaeales archaeon]